MSRRRFYFSLLLIPFVACASHKPLVSKPVAQPPSALIFSNVAVFDGEKRIPQQDVVVQNGIISAVGAHGTLPLPKSAEVIPGVGKTLLPGFWDSHVHIGGTNGDEPWAATFPNERRHMEALLYAGVTHAFDAGRDCDSAALAREVKAGTLQGPQLLRATRLYTAPNGHPLPLVRAFVPWPFNYLMEDLAREVASEKEGLEKLKKDIELESPQFLKIVYNAVPVGSPHLTLEMLRSLIQMAHAQNLRAAVHVGSAKEAVEAAEAGADVLTHVPWEDILSEQEARRIAQTGVVITTTRRIYSMAVDLPKGTFHLLEMEKAALPDHPGTFRPMPNNFSMKGFPDSFLKETMPRYHDNIGANIKKLRAAEATLVVGTDASITGVIHGGALHRELEALVQLGLGTEEVLAMATSRSARLLGRSQSLGVIAPNASADMVLVEGNPVEDITHTRNIVAIWKEGVRIQRH